MQATLWLLLVAAQEAEHAAEGAGGFSSPFEVNFGLFFWTWVVFIALFFVLKKFAWPAILRATEERERKIQQQLEEAERMNAEAKQALEEHRRLLSGAKEEAQHLINDAKQVAEKEREQLLQKARDEQQQMLDRAKREIDMERDRAMMQLRTEAVDIALAAASKLIEQRLDAKGDRKIVEQYLASLKGDAR